MIIVIVNLIKMNEISQFGGVKFIRNTSMSRGWGQSIRFFTDTPVSTHTRKHTHANTHANTHTGTHTPNIRPHTNLDTNVKFLPLHLCNYILD